MDPKDNRYISLSDLYLAYRKAKAEAFYETTHFHALAFSEYETNLDRNLRALSAVLHDPRASWTTDASWLGGYAYAPKSVDLPQVNETERIFYRFLDPVEDWERQFANSRQKRVKASFRLVIVPSVDFQILSALWILKVGHKFDAALDPDLSFGNRLRRSRESEWTDSGIQRSINTDCVGLFAPYFSAYAKWRAQGLAAMRASLEARDRIVVVTMDLQRFYHRVSPTFLLRDAFLAAVRVSLDDDERRLTKQLISAIQTWYEATPDRTEHPSGAIPVGLSASKIIANVLLTEFDQKIQKNVDPVYYGRYVDDIFMVVRLKDSPLTGDDVMRRLADQVPDLLKYKAHVPGSEGASGLKVSLPYARDSELFFTGSKQKVFNLAGSHGLDLVTQISEQIRKHSSEHRLLPLLPSSAEGMASRALLAQPSATLEADALRKADAISVRRLGLSLLLRDVESYARDLQPSVWKARRLELYGLVQRHVVTPVGFFDFSSYIHRAFGLMVACGDFDEATELLSRLVKVAGLLQDTTTAGKTDSEQFEMCLRFYAQALAQVALQASTVTRFPWKRGRQFLSVLRSIRNVHMDVALPNSVQKARQVSTRLLHHDWGRRPYRDYWIHNARRELPNPPVPSPIAVRKILNGVRVFRTEASLRIPYWPGIVFPTRPLSLSEITLEAPHLIRDQKKLRRVLFAMRGARMRDWDGPSIIPPETPTRAEELVVSTKTRRKVRIAVPSLLTTEKELNAARDGRPRLGIERYERIRRISNDMMKENPQPHYVVYPECSLPLNWATSIAYKLATRGISMLAGIEYQPTRSGIRNDVLISLSTRWPWYASALTFRQPKSAPAHKERESLWKAGHKRLYRPKPQELAFPVYVHGDFCFGVLICSDLTDVALRNRFQGSVDALFVIEWNQDVDTFGFLVEAAAQDLHAYVVQVNNREYGDSRVRAPRRIVYERDSVRVKGGLSDYHVSAQIDFEALRHFQRKSGSSSEGDFKPTPIGYKMSARRQGGL
jgi:hypothetical protein